MNKPINLIMASAVMASTVTLMSCAEKAGTTLGPVMSTPLKLPATATKAKIETVQLALTGLK